MLAAAGVVALLFVAQRAGIGIILPSPAAESPRPRLELVRKQSLLPAGEAGGAHHRLMIKLASHVHRLEGGRSGVFRFQTTRAHQAVLKVVARLAAPFHAGGECTWMEVALDGNAIWRRSLSGRWHAYAFALPRLDRGWHRLEVLLAGVPMDHGRGMTLAVQQMAIEGVHGSVPEIAETDGVHLAARSSDPPGPRGWRLARRPRR